MASLTQIFDWFKENLMPTEAQFHETWKSFWHKSERLPQSQILGLNDALNNKASKEDLANVTTNFKGYHTSLAALLAIHPQNENRKDFFAWVGTPYPGTVHKVFADKGAWTDTGEVPTQQEIDLAEYAKKTEVEVISNKFNLGATAFNIFNKASAIQGKYLNGDGKTTTDSALHIYSDYIPVEAGKTYCIGGDDGSDRPWYFVYSQDKNTVVKAYVTPNAKNVFTAPTGAYWLRFNGYVADLDTFMVVEGNKYPDEYIDYGSGGNNDGKLKESALSENVTLWNELLDNEVITNLFDKSAVVQGRNLDADGKTVGSSLPNYFYSDYIPIEAGKTYCIGGDDGSDRPWYFVYSQDKNTVVKAYVTPNAKNVFTAPTGAYWLRINGYLTDLDIFMIVEGDKYPTKYIAYGETNESGLGKIKTKYLPESLSGGNLRMSVLGDSYSTFGGFMTPNTNRVFYNGEGTGTDVTKVQQTWWYKLLQEKGFMLEINNSYSGSPICNTGYGGVDASEFSFLGRMNNLGRPDIIFTFGGTNDSWANVPIGEYKYSGYTDADLKTFRPAFAYMLQYLSEHNPNALIYQVTNSQLSNDITNSIQTICNELKITNVVLPVFPKPASGHPNEEGMTAICNTILEYLK